MKIGIYTIHACNNFGALLQAYATARFINDLGHQSEIVNVVTSAEEKKMQYKFPWTNIKGVINNFYAIFNPEVQRKKKNFEIFRSLLPLSDRYKSYEEVKNKTPQYDIHLVGSDQVWNLESGMREGFYFLPFLPKTSFRMSYASSFGNVDAVKNYSKEIKNYLTSFTHISVREQDACYYLKNEVGLEASCVLDPIFLLDATQWGKIAGEHQIVKGDYILYYGFDTNKTCAEAISLLRKNFKIPVIGISVSLHSPYKFDRFLQEAGPSEFLNLIKNAKFIFTSSFHGMAFSIVFRKDFAVLRHGSRMSRMMSLLNYFNIEDRVISDCNELEYLIHNKCIIDYASLDYIFEKKVLESQKWLSTHLL